MSATAYRDVVRRNCGKNEFTLYKALVITSESCTHI